MKPFNETHEDQAHFLEVRLRIKQLAEQYNALKYFEVDPIIFPRHFCETQKKDKQTSLQDIEIAAVLSAHLAWGRRELIVRDCRKMFDEMQWSPQEYVMNAEYRRGKDSLHRTILWDDFAGICQRLKLFYTNHSTLEKLHPDEIRTFIYGQKPNPSAANKKIHMMRRWMVRRDGIVDLGLWSNLSPANLIIPLDVHVHRSALKLGITQRKSADIKTAVEITNYLKLIFPNDPCLGDFALFAYQANL